MKQIAKRQLLLLAGDALLAIGSFYLGYLIRLRRPVNVMEVYTGATVFSVLTLAFLLYVFDLYNHREHYLNLQFVPRLLLAVGSFTLVSMAFFYFCKSHGFGRGAFAIAVLILTPALIAWRLLYDQVARVAQRPKRIIILGAGSPGRAICQALIRSPRQFTVVGFLDDDVKLHGQEIMRYSVLGPTSDITDHCGSGEVNCIVVATANSKSEALIVALLQCKMAGVTVYDMPDLYETLTRQLPVEHIGDKWLLFGDGYELIQNRVVQRVKRLFDVWAASVGLVVTLPISLLTAIAIKIESRGGAIYRQVRIGKGGNPFELLKFRSMVHDAEEKSGAVWADLKDPRATRVGRIIRMLKIDEIPQMWNVLKGEMSLVGPRPERPEFVELLSKSVPYYGVRHNVAPGVTGWAQVNYPYGASVEDAVEKLKYDLYYVRHMNLLMDLNILFSTVRTVIFPKAHEKHDGDPTPAE